MAVTDYGFNYWSVSVNGQPLADISEQADAISFPARDTATVAYSADGNMIGASSGRRGGPVMIRCMPGGQADDFFNDLANRFDTGDLNMELNLEAVLRNGDETIETVTCSDGIFTQVPSAVQIGGGVPAMMEYQITFKVVTRER